MIQKVTMYQAVCDGCGEICADSWTTAWESPESARYYKSVIDSLNIQFERL